MSEEWAPSDRRTYLKYAGAAAVTALAGCSSGNDAADANHQVPHPNDETVPEVERTAQSLDGSQRPEDVVAGKGDVAYSHTPDGDECCSNCSLYVPDADGDGYGACITVSGKIHPSDHCSYWGPAESEEAVPCNS